MNTPKAELPVARALDWFMDKSLVLGYTKIGPMVRRHWWPPDPAPDALVGEHVLVTGGSGGLGLAAARGMARLGATVHLTGRDEKRLGLAQERLERDVPGGLVEPVVADISNLAETREFARAFAARIPRLRALVHNAGVMPPERVTTDEGHELALATHVLGPQVLTYELAGILAGGRVVVVTSGGAYGQRLDADDPEYLRAERSGTYSGVTAYARTKRMQLVLTGQWAADLAGRGVVAHAMHPGWADTPGVTDGLPRFAKVMAPLLRDDEGGADTAVWLAATDEPIGNGGFWNDRRRRATHYAPIRVESAADVHRFWSFVCGATGTADTAATS